jgi:hypothetical protein
LLVDSHDPAIVGSPPVKIVEERNGDGDRIEGGGDEIIEGEVSTVGVDF